MIEEAQIRTLIEKIRDPDLNDAKVAFEVSHDMNKIHIQ